MVRLRSDLDRVRARLVDAGPRRMLEQAAWSDPCGTIGDTDVLDGQCIAIILPALNEAQVIGQVLDDLPDWLDTKVVVDNGSTDPTAAIAQRHGALVVTESRRGYGAACLAGLTALTRPPAPDIIVFMDADRSDDPADMTNLLAPILRDEADLVIGSRVLGDHEPGALTWPQHAGNALASGLLRHLWNVPCTDLGPFRAIRYSVLQRLAMDDLDYGWTVQMQIRAARLGYRIREIPVRYRRRVGRSKISGTVRGVFAAGYKILTTIGREYLTDRVAHHPASQLIIFSRLPQPGSTKTRMILLLGPQGAADLQRQMTRHTLDVAENFSDASGCRIQVRHTGGERHAMAATFGYGRDYQDQGPGDLGRRLQRAFDDAFASRHQHALCIGSDCPSITVEILSQASRALSNHDVVIGPAVDGGYYLIGLRAPMPGLFENIPWGTERVYEQTRRRIAARGLSCHVLATLSDVDEPADLPVWRSVLDAKETQASRPLISVIIPTLNEADRLPQAISSVTQSPGVEVIVADGGSDDATREVATQLGAAVVQSERGRGSQMNAGAAAAHGRYLLFLHADTRLPFGYDRQVHRILNTPGCVAGAFRMAFDRSTPSLRWIEWATDLRSRHLQLPYGDQALFLARHTFDAIGGFKPIPVMEDFDLVHRLREHGYIAIARQTTITSARKYQRHGIWLTVARHQWMILRWQAARAACEQGVIGAPVSLRT
ncbi:MAG: DUF2064 domain-containing protein [Planctomycetes bacterium]|nr:DUF2064 domain-containing protein [Planctomycetota bacterium]